MFLAQLFKAFSLKKPIRPLILMVDVLGTAFLPTLYASISVLVKAFFELQGF